MQNAAAWMDGAGSGRAQRKRKQVELFGAVEAAPLTAVDEVVAGEGSGPAPLTESEEGAEDVVDFAETSAAALTDARLRSPSLMEIYTSIELLKLSAAETKWGAIVGAARLAGLLLATYQKDSLISKAIRQNRYWEVNATRYCAILYCQNRSNGDDEDHDRLTDLKWLKGILAAAFKVRQQSIALSEIAVQAAIKKSGEREADEEDRFEAQNTATEEAFAAYPLTEIDHHGVKVLDLKKFADRVYVFVTVYQELCMDGEVVHDGKSNKPIELDAVTLDKMNRRMFQVTKSADFLDLVLASRRNRLLLLQTKAKSKAVKLRTFPQTKLPKKASGKRGTAAGKNKQAELKDAEASLPSSLTVTEKGSAATIEQTSTKEQGTEEQDSDLYQSVPLAEEVQPTWNWVPASAEEIKPWYLAVAMMQENYQAPSNVSMYGSLVDLLANKAACQAVEKIVLIKNDSMMYYDICKLHNCPHGGIFKAEDVVDLVSKAVVQYDKAVEVTARGRSILGRDVNVLYSGTHEFQQYAQVDTSNEMFRVGELAQGMYNYFCSPLVNGTKAKEMLSRDSLQISIGVANHGYVPRVPNSGKLAEMAIQNKDVANEFFPGHSFGHAARALTQIRAKLAMERFKNGDPPEYSDADRNREYGEAVSAVLGVPGCEAEFYTLVALGDGALITQMREVLIKKLPASDQARFRNRDVSLKLHCDTKNSICPQYSRVAVLSAVGRVEGVGLQSEEQIRFSLVATNRICVDNRHNKEASAVPRCLAVVKLISDNYEAEGYGSYEADGSDMEASNKTVEVALGLVSASAEFPSTENTESWVSMYVESSSAESGAWQRHRPSCDKADESVDVLERKSSIFVRLLAKKVVPNKFAAYSGLVSACKRCASAFGWNNKHLYEVMVVILVSTKSPAVVMAILLKWADSGVIGKRVKGPHAFAGAEDGEVGWEFHQECSIKLFGNIPKKISRAHSFSPHSFIGKCKLENFQEVATLFAVSALELQKIVTHGDDHEDVKTEELLKRFRSKVKGFGDFACQQIFPLAVLLGLSTNLPRSVHATIAKNKGHHKYMETELGLKSESAMTSVMECVAEQLGTHPVKVENCLCENFRKNKDVLDFFFRGQTFYDVRRSAWREGLAVYEKEWGDDGVWTEVDGSREEMVD